MPDLPPRLKVLYPFAANWCSNPEGRLHYVDAGEGEAVVMLHGNPTWSFFYRDLILAMQGNHRCLALDHLGCGLSDKPQEADYTLEGHIQRACDWLGQTGIDGFHLIVHDWGGAIGFGLADRLGEKIKGITILNTAAFAFPSIPFRIAVCRFPVIGSLLVKGANAFVLGATRMTTVQPLSPAVAEGFRYPYGSWNDRVAVHRFVRDIPMRPSHPSWNVLQSVEESLPQWNAVPVQIVWGMHDWCFHAQFLQQWEARYPHASVHRMENSGHYLFEDEGQRAIECIQAFSDTL